MIIRRASSIQAGPGCLCDSPGPPGDRVKVPDSEFQKLVTERVAAGNPEREDSPTHLLKRLKQLEQESEQAPAICSL